MSFGSINDAIVGSIAPIGAVAHPAGRVYVALHQVASQPVAHLHRPLQVLRGADLVRELRPLVRETSPLDDPVPAADARAVTWCEPQVRVDVAYLQRMTSGRLRQPVVRALRTDGDVDPWETP